MHISIIQKQSKGLLLTAIADYKLKIHMNIDKLLRKIDQQPKQPPKAPGQNRRSADPHKPTRTLVNDGKYYQHCEPGIQARNMQTLQSIGTVSSQPDNNDQSFVVPDSVLRDKLGIKNSNSQQHKDNVKTPRQPQHFVLKEECTDRKNSKLDEQLTKIQKMKHLYQSRQNRSLSKSHNKNSKSMNLLQKNQRQINNDNRQIEVLMSIDKNKHHSSHAAIEDSCNDNSHSQSKARSYSNSHEKLQSSKKKHKLKPSCTPSFNKFVANVKEQAHRAVCQQDRVENQHLEDAELCRNIYLEEFLANSQNQKCPKNNTQQQKPKVKSQQGQMYKRHQKSQEMSDEYEHGLGPLEQSQFGQQYQSSRYIISPEHPTMSNKQGIDKPNSTRNPHKFYKNQQENIKHLRLNNQTPSSQGHLQQKQIKTNVNQNMYLSFDENNLSSFIQHPPQDESSCNLDRYTSPQSHHKNTPASCNPTQQYVTRDEMSELIRLLHRKQEQLNQQVQQLRQENRQFRSFKVQIQRWMNASHQQNQQLKVLLKKRNEEKQQLQKLVEKGLKQKEQLEEMVKDVLYEREKQKMHKVSRENSHRESLTHKSSKQNTYLENTRGQTHYPDHHNKSRQPVTKQHADNNGGNKMKVQNLLQKLHIKVDRT